MAFPLEQFLAALHLGIISILDLEPRGALVVYGARLCFATIPSRSVSHTRRNNAVPKCSMWSAYRSLDVGRPVSKRLKLVLAICEPLRPNILAVIHQKIEGIEAGLAAMKEQIAELGSPAVIQTDNLPIKHGLSSLRQHQPLAKVCEGVEWISVARD